MERVSLVVKAAPVNSATFFMSMRVYVPIIKGCGWSILTEQLAAVCFGHVVQIDLGVFAQTVAVSHSFCSV